MKFKRNFTLALILILFVAGTFSVYGQRRERRRFSYSERIIKIMEDAGCPLSDSQREDLEKLRPGPQTRKRLDKILTEDQQKALQKHDHDRRLMMISRTLEDSEYPLTEKQKDELKAVKPGSKARIEIGKILTEEQKNVMKEAEKKRRTPRRPFMRMSQILKEAGCPLTEEQSEKMKDIKPEQGVREKYRSILTPEQKKVLDEAYKRIRENRRPQNERRLERRDE